MMGFRYSLLSVLLVALLQVVNAANIIVNGIQYYAASEAVTTISGSVGQLKSLSKDADLVPLTVIEASSKFDTAAFKSVVENYTAVDDVFNTGFLKIVYLKNGSSRSKVSGYGTQLFMQSSNNRCSKEIPAGPYFISVSTGNVYQAYRLYSDIQGAFTEGLIAKSDGTFDVLPAALQGVQSSTIGVLSRLYYTKSEAKPLAGVRLGIKDIYDIAGVKTGCGNRAYYNLYPAANVTAVAVQRLIDAGAVIVGKMKTSQFANGETATADWVDYHSPFNPRGDGYQDPSSSSSGPGAGIGAYPWLDITLGSDTGGSVRNPAQVNGAFGNRPSRGLVSLDGVMPLSPALDTAGFFAREAGLWKTTAAALYGENITFTTSFPKKIYTSGFPVNATTEAQTVLLSFLSKLEDFLSAETEAFDYDKAWNTTGPVPGQTISAYLGYVYPTLISQQQYNLLTVPFYADYAAANQGRLPAINPTPKTRWAWGQNNITADALESALTNKTVFMDWWNSKVLIRDNQTCSDSLFLYPGTLGTPSYRNVYKSAPGIPSGFSVSRISNFAEVPDMVAPIGMAPYNSTITGQVEYLPVAIDILAAKGCDGMIFELVEKLQTAGIIKPVGTGSLLYSGDDEILL